MVLKFVRRNKVILSLLTVMCFLVGVTNAVAISKIKGSMIQRNSITSKQMKNGKGVTGADIQNRSIGLADLSAKTVTSLKGEQGPAGATGATGAAGATGPQGPAGAAGQDGAPGVAVFASAYLDNCCTSLAFSDSVGLDLGSTNTETSGYITTTRETRLMASATVKIRTVSGNTVATAARCWLEVLPSDNSSAAVEMHPKAMVNFPAEETYHIMMPLLGSTTVAAGTWNVRVVCNLNGPVGTVETESFFINVWGMDA